jgi:hypothetical protein
VADGVLVGDVRITTVYSNPIRTWLIELVGGVLLHGPVMQDPWVDLVIRRDGSRSVLYRESRFQNEEAQKRIAYVAEWIRDVGFDQFLREASQESGGGG